MPAVDPFSAAFVPMRSFDDIPSKPLPFAATLLPNDQSAHASASDHESCRLPKPRKPYKDTIPLARPSSPYAHVRHGSFDWHDFGQSLEYSTTVEVGSDEWMQRRVEECVDTSRGVLDLNNLGLTKLSTKISDLRDLVTLPISFSPRVSTTVPKRMVSESPRFPESSAHELARGPPPSRSLGFGARQFTRVSSAPATMAHAISANAPMIGPARAPSGLGARFSLPAQDGDIQEEGSSADSLQSSPILTPPNTRSAFSRSKTGAVKMNSLIDAGIPQTSIEIMAARNSLTNLPTALFRLNSLTVLSVRGNNLEHLPAAIGALRNLKELNISNNRIKELPSSIVDLRLSTFHVHPNPLHRRSSKSEPDAVITMVAPSSRILGPLERNLQQTVPRLYDMCLNLVITPRPPSGLSPLHDSFLWETEKGENHPLLDVDALHARVPAVSRSDLRRCLQAAKSTSHASHHGSSGNKRHAFASLGVSASPAKGLPYPTSHRTDSPDDASENPFYSPCPSPRHMEFETPLGLVSARSARRLFLRPAEERLEWRELFGQGELPLRWKGCSPGCLAFLEAEVEDEDGWGLSDFM